MGLLFLMEDSADSAVSAFDCRHEADTDNLVALAESVPSAPDAAGAEMQIAHRPQLTYPAEFLSSWRGRWRGSCLR